MFEKIVPVRKNNALLSLFNKNGEYIAQIDVSIKNITTDTNGRTASENVLM